ASREASKNSRDGNRIGEGAGTPVTLLQTSDRKKAYFRGARAFDVTGALAVLRRAMPAWRAPVVAAFARERRDPFSILVSCLLSLRTRDETTGPASRRLFRLARTPAASEMALRAKLPAGEWRGLKTLLVAFGQTICRPLSPRCSACPLDAMCPRRGVGASR